MKVVQRRSERKDLLEGIQFDFRARHSTTLHYMRLADHTTLHFNNNMSTTAVFLVIEEYLLQRHLGLLYKLVSKVKWLPQGMYKQECRNFRLSSLSPTLSVCKR